MIIIRKTILDSIHRLMPEKVGVAGKVGVASLSSLQDLTNSMCDLGCCIMERRKAPLRYLALVLFCLFAAAIVVRGKKIILLFLHT